MKLSLYPAERVISRKPYEPYKLYKPYKLYQSYKIHQSHKLHKPYRVYKHFSRRYTILRFTNFLQT
eukprot:UN14494